MAITPIPSVVNGVINLSTTLSWSQLVTLGFDDNGVYTLTLQVSDNTNTTVSTDSSLTINNVAPTATIDATTPVSVNEGSSFTFQGTVTDPAAVDQQTVTVDFGDGTVTVFELEGEQINLTHTYANRRA